MSRKKKKRRGRRGRGLDVYEDPDCNGEFAYIAGCTSGGFAYGVTWEEVGIDPDLPFEEKVRRLGEQEDQLAEQQDRTMEDDPEEDESDMPEDEDEE